MTVSLGIKMYRMRFITKQVFVRDSTDHISLTVGYLASMGLGYALGTYLHPEEIAEPVNAFLNVATTGISHLFKHSIPEGEAGHYHYEYTMTIWGGGVNHQMGQCTIIRCEKGCRETTIDWYSIIGFYANENWGE